MKTCCENCFSPHLRIESLACGYVITPHLNSKREHGRTKANSNEKYFFYVFEKFIETFTVCFLPYACVASENHVGLITLQLHMNN